MRHKLFRFHAAFFKWRAFFTEELLALILVLFVFVVPVSASTRFEDRSLYMNSALAGETTDYKISLKFMSPDPVGSLDMLFCIDPIPYMPCETPPGLDVSNAVLTEQTGETGFAITTQTENHILLSRSPSMIPTPGLSSSYTLSGVVNPSGTIPSFSIRLKSLSTSDGTGPQIDFGSVKGQITTPITIETQVPPQLIFCLAEIVHDNCEGTNDTYYRDMGLLSPTTTLTAQSQMAVGTNATAGFSITAYGNPMAAGTNVIDSLEVPTESIPGVNQFGINLVENQAPAVGKDPEGIWDNALPTSDYGQPDKYKYVPGDLVASSPNVSLMKKFTVSYIVNSSADLRPGVYTTTVTFIASGSF